MTTPADETPSLERLLAALRSPDADDIPTLERLVSAAQQAYADALGQLDYTLRFFPPWRKAARDFCRELRERLDAIDQATAWLDGLREELKIARANARRQKEEKTK